MRLCWPHSLSLRPTLPESCSGVRAGLTPLGPQSLKVGVKEGRAGTYFPAVQTANKGEGMDRGAVQPHMVSLKDDVMQLQAVQCLRLGYVQATHEAAGTDVNGPLAGKRRGIPSGQHSPRHLPTTHTGPGPANLASLCPYSSVGLT